ncbi:MAG: hypothetical protein ACRD1A_09160, partial [Terriglobales bacterium]
MRGKIIGMLIIAGGVAAAGQSVAKAPLTIDAIVNIKYPSAPQWSPDGHDVMFTWDEAGVYTRYEVDADHPGPPQAAARPPFSGRPSVGRAAAGIRSAATRARSAQG